MEEEEREEKKEERKEKKHSVKPGLYYHCKINGLVISRSPLTVEMSSVLPSYCSVSVVATTLPLEGDVLAPFLTSDNTPHGNRGEIFILTHGFCVFRHVTCDGECGKVLHVE